MKDFKKLYEHAIKEAFYNELYSVIYSERLTTDDITANTAERFRELHQRYLNLRNLGDTEFHEFETNVKPIPATHIVEVTSYYTDHDLPYKCTGCESELWESTRYCPHCGRYNIDFKEEK